MAVLGQMGAEKGSVMRVCAPPPSIEQMLAANPGKTPISLLQEYGTRIGKTPVYDLLKAEGQAHQPNFTFRVTVGDTSCTGEEGLGSLGWGVHSQGPICITSWKLFTVRFSKTSGGWRDSEVGVWEALIGRAGL